MGDFVDGNVLSDTDLNDFGAVDEIEVTQTTTTGTALTVDRNLASGSTNSPLVFIRQNHATDDQHSLHAQNNGTGVAGIFYNDKDGANTNYTYLCKYAGNASNIETNRFYRNIASAVTVASVVKINQDHAGDDQHALEINQDGTGSGIAVSADGSIIASGKACGQFVNTASLDYAEFGRNRADSNGSNLILRDLASANTAGPVLKVWQNSEGDDQPAFYVDNDGNGNGMTMLNEGTGDGISITQSATACTNGVIDITNASTANSLTIDQNGNATNGAVYIDNAGTGDAISINQVGNVTNGVIDITNAGTGRSICVDQNGNTGTNGALEIDNNGNTGYGLKVTSTANPSQPLVYLNGGASFDEDVLYINFGGSSNANLYIDNNSDSNTADGIEIDLNAPSGATNKGIDIDLSTLNTGQAMNIDCNHGAAEGINISMPSATAIALDIVGQGLATGGFSTSCPFQTQDGLYIKNGLGGINHGQLIGRDIMIGIDGDIAINSSKLDIPGVRFIRLNKSTVEIEERETTITQKLQRESDFKIPLNDNEHLNSVESVSSSKLKRNKGNKGTLEKEGDFSFTSSTGKIRFKLNQYREDKGDGKKRKRKELLDEDVTVNYTVRIDDPIPNKTIHNIDAMNMPLLNDWSVLWLKETGLSDNICPDDTAAMDPNTELTMHYTIEDDYLAEYGADTYILAYISPGGKVTMQL